MLVTLALIAFGLGGIVYGEYQRRLHEATTLEREYWKGQSKSNDARAENWRQIAADWRKEAFANEAEYLDAHDELRRVRFALEHTRRNGPCMGTAGVPEPLGETADRRVPKYS